MTQTSQVGIEYTGFAGDTAASALLAHGVIETAPSMYVGRPRGILAAGVEGTFHLSSSHILGYDTNLPHYQTQSAGFSVTPVPEPGSFLLLSTGLLGAVGILRRRFTECPGEF